MASCGWFVATKLFFRRCLVGVADLNLRVLVIQWRRFKRTARCVDCG